MKYFSTNRQSPEVSFRDATIQGQAPDKGLYFPGSLPAFNAQQIDQFGRMDEVEMGIQIMQPYTGNDLPEPVLRDIIQQTLSFPIPLVHVSESMYSLELFHGPTLAFKDVGARFMSRCLGYFLRNESRKVTVLVATSGDTGGAVASGFLGVDGVDVVILYPSGKVSPVQEKQLTTAGQNITAIEITGDFDDCQRLVKQAFNDEELTASLFLTSANSINVARWLPQQLYYFLAWKQWPEKSQPPVFVVPSGNFGNICAGLLAHVTGLPARHFVAGCNANNVVPEFLETGTYRSRPAIPTISNAMDVGDPSNFVRILELFRQQYPLLKEGLSAFSFTDEQTLEEISRVYKEYNYLLDPHGAVASLALSAYRQAEGGKGIILETAHPVKFPEPVATATGKQPEIPTQIRYLMDREKQAEKLSPGYGHFKEFLLSRSR